MAKPVPNAPGAPPAYQFPTPAMIDAYQGSVNSTTTGAISTALAVQASSRLTAPTAPSALMRGIRGFRNWLGISILGADAPTVLFGPQQPLQPIGQQPDQAAIGRPWDYPVGYNTRTTPRQGAGVSFKALRALADYDVLAVIIQRVKDKIVSQKWQFVPADLDKRKPGGNGGDDIAARADQLRAFWEMPDREHSFDDWCRLLLDQCIVYDAPALYLRPTRGGQLYAAEVIDGALVAPKIGADGKTPAPEIGPAYQQVLHGIGAVDYIKPVAAGEAVPLDPEGNPFPELLYKPRNPRVHTLYGYGPIEQVITTVEISLARQKYLKSYYTDGATPDLIFNVPETWNPDQIAKFKLWWDSVLAGNLGARRGTMFVPNGVAPYDTKEKALTDKTDEWLVRILCFALGVNPMPFIQQMNRGQEKTHHQEAAAEGLEPWLEWLANTINTIVRLKWGYRDLVFRWKEDDAVDEATRATIDVQLVGAKIYHPDEIRQRRGDDPMPDDLRLQMDMANFNAAANSTVLPEDQQQAKDESAQALAASRPAPFGGVAPPGNKAPPPAPGVAGKLGKGHATPGRSRAPVRGY